MKSSGVDMRFSSADWYGNPQNIIVGGAGTIGSNIVPILSRLGHSITLYDMDIVEKHNLGVQLFPFNSISVKKVTAVNNVNFYINGSLLSSVLDEEYTEDSMISNIMISCFDNMKARKIMFENWEKFLHENESTKHNFLFIDGRMDFNQFQIYYVTSDRLSNYRRTLFTDESVDNVPCSLQTTPYIGPAIAAFMSNGLCNFLGNLKLKDVIYELPFKIEYKFPNMMYNEFTK